MYQIAHKWLNADGSVNFEKAIEAGRQARIQAIREGFARLRVSARGIFHSLGARSSLQAPWRFSPGGYLRRVRGA